MAQARDEAGNIWEVDAQGNPVRLIQAAGGGAIGGVQIKPADPTMQYKGPQAAAELAIAQSKIAMTPAEMAKAEADARRADAEARKAEADLRSGNLEAQKNAQERKGRSENLRALQGQIDRVRQLYGQSLRGGAPNTFTRFVPGFINPAFGQFDTAGAGLAEQALEAFRVPGIGSQSDAELRAFVEANRPLSTDSDLQIEEKLSNIQRRLDAANAGLGQQAPAAAAQDRQAMAIGGIPGAGLPPAGPTQIDPAGGAPLLSPQDRDFLSRNARNLGADGIRQYFAARGLQVPDSEVQAAVDYYSRGGQQDAAVNVPQGGGSLLGQIAASPTGSYFSSALDNATAGNLDSIGGLLGADPNSIRSNLEAQSNANPIASTLGGFTGAIAGMEATGGLIGGIPRLAGLARAGGGIVPDTLFGAATGAGQADDGNRLTGALTGGSLAGAGNVIGGTIVGGLGRAVRGVSSPAVRYLNDAGVPLTAGQIMGGGGPVGRGIKSLEDAATSVPFLGRLVDARRQEGIEGFNRAAFREALEPIGAQVQGKVGNNAIEQAQTAVGDAYQTALGPVRLSADNTYNAEMAAARAAGGRLPEPLRDNFISSLANRVDPFVGSGNMTGRDLQAAVKGLRTDAGSIMRRSEPMADIFKDRTVDVENALFGLAERQAPGTVDALSNANQAYRNLSILEDAALKADNAGGVFTPAQLGMATKQNTKRFGGKKAAARGDVPLRDLQQAGQEILPSTIGNSGTTDRALANIVLPGLLGGAAATGGAADYLSPETAGTLGILSALATRPGRQVTQRLLISRPEAARSIGDQLYNNRAIGGMIGAPLLLGFGNQ